jgi:uncharacterized membrane protein YraQ (UPF0718 family)
MNSLKANSTRKSEGTKSTNRMLIFPVVVVVVYGILFAIMPDKTLLALKSSSNVFLSIAKSLGLVLIVMLVLNLLVKPAQIVKVLGSGTGIKGMILPAAGIISAGPIYVWYPLLKDLKEKGAGIPQIAVFLYNRAVKPFLLPVMIAYFGWEYVAILTVLTILGSIVVGYSLGILMKEKESL